MITADDEERRKTESELDASRARTPCLGTRVGRVLRCVRCEQFASTTHFYEFDVDGGHHHLGGAKEEWNDAKRGAEMHIYGELRAAGHPEPFNHVVCDECVKKLWLETIGAAIEDVEDALDGLQHELLRVEKAMPPMA